jgi:hypothetical protein
LFFFSRLSRAHVVVKASMAEAERVINLDEEDLERKEEDEDDLAGPMATVVAAPEKGGEEAAPKKAKTQAGRQKSWVHEKFLCKDGKYVCQELVPKVVDGKSVNLPCGKQYTYNPDNPATTGMLNHMASAHGYSRSGIAPTLKQSHLKREEDGTAALDVVVKWTPQDLRTVSLVTDLARWFAIDGEPPNIVNHVGFQAFMEKRFPQFPGVSAPTIVARLKVFSESFVKWFVGFQESVEWFGATTDGWSSDAKDHYRTFTLHFFIPGTWRLVGLALETGVCGGKDHQIRDFLHGVIAKYKLMVNRIVAITTDNANAEVAGVRLADLQRVPCGCHLLNLSMKLVMDPGKPRRGNRPERPPSPVLEPLDKLQKIVQKLHNAPLLMQALVEDLTEWGRRNGKPVPRIPTKPNNTRWNSVCLMLESCFPIREQIDQLLVKHAGTYTLERMGASDWTVVGEMAKLLHPFKTVSNYMEGERYPTVPEYLGHLAGACFKAFYQDVANHATLHPSVQTMLRRLRDDIGKRLWETENDVTLTGLMLHPVFKNLAPPATGIPESAFVPGSILRFFFKDLKPRMTKAALNELKRLNIKIEPKAPAAAEDNPLAFIVQGYNAAHQRTVKPEHEINSWLNMPVVLGASVAEYWERDGAKWPLLQQLARANFVAQTSSAASERVWSAADDVSGGDRARVSPEVLNAQLVLKKNTGVQAEILGCNVFDVLK